MNDAEAVLLSFYIQFSNIITSPYFFCRESVLLPYRLHRAVAHKSRAVAEG